MSLSPERREILTNRTETYRKHLDDAVPYLLERGISREAADMFHLGVVPYEPDEKRAGRLSIPYLRPAGVVQIKYRCMIPEHGDHKDKELKCPKYLTEDGCGTHLYNSPVLLEESGLVVITEGELDALTVQAYCGIAAVGYPGVDTWKDNEHFRLCFEGVNEVVVIADGDDTGRKAAKRVADSIGFNARTVEMPDGQDANSYIASSGAGAFIERLKQ